MKKVKIMKGKIITKNEITPLDVAKYFLLKSIDDGELISPLKMQKLVYYAYVWVLVLRHKKLFDEGIEAWPSGPVAPSLYMGLKKYGSAPISEECLGSKKEIKDLLSKLPKEITVVLDKVYEKYMTKTAFELVVLTHSETPWIQTRKGLKATDHTNNVISDKLIMTHYGQKV